MTRQVFSLLFPSLVAVAGVSLASQSAPPEPQGGRPGYDIDFIGPPMADPVLQHAKETLHDFHVGSGGDRQPRCVPSRRRHR